MKQRFTPEELERIQEAVSHAETKTAGEIVPVIVPRSDRYEAAIWKTAVLFALVTLAASVLAHQFYHGWGLAWIFTGWGTALTGLVAGLIGALLAVYVPAFRRLMAGEEAIALAVHRRAMQAFVEEEVFATRDRTGVLIFISVFEHRIEVIGDSEINRAVLAEEWMEIVDRLRNAIREGELARGIVDAMAMGGRLLAKAGVEIRPDDRNELPDQLRIRGER